MHLSQKITVSMNFYSDWIALLRKGLENIGYSIEVTEEDSKVCCLYFNVAKRRITPRCRRIYISREFSCPQQHLPGLRLLEDKIRAGQDLTPHLGRKIHKLNYDDPILNDWSIHHFHLGLTYNNEGLIEGTPYILVARVTPYKFYMIDVVEHDAWHHRRYIEILHSNWPRSIELWKCNGVLALSDPPDDEAVKILRDAQICYMVQTEDGTVYLPIGGRYSSSGISAEVVRRCLQAEQILETMEHDVKKQVENILQQDRPDGNMTCSNFHFQFILGQRGAHAVGAEALIAFHLKERQNCGELYGHPSIPLKLWQDEWINTRQIAFNRKFLSGFC